MQPKRISDIDGDIVTHQTLGDCIKELIEASYEIYMDLLRTGRKTTIVCGGQSPAYYCLAMMNFKIFQPDLVNIVILPHSKSGKKAENQKQENEEYCQRLRDKNIKLRTNVVIIDGVHTGTGILALESALYHCYPHIHVTKIAINTREGIAQIDVAKEIALPCEFKFSDIYPRLVTRFTPDQFSKSSKFITDFMLENNPIAEMIIDVAKMYPETPVEETGWFKANNEITKDIAEERLLQEKEEAAKIQREKEAAKIRLKAAKLQREAAKKAAKLQREAAKIQREAAKIQRERMKQYFVPIVLENPKRYKCRLCGGVSGETLEITHTYNCENKGKKPRELAQGERKVDEASKSGVEIHEKSSETSTSGNPATHSISLRF